MEMSYFHSKLHTLLLAIMTRLQQKVVYLINLKLFTLVFFALAFLLRIFIVLSWVVKCPTGIRYKASNFLL